MNLVALLIAPTVVRYATGTDRNDFLRLVIALAAAAVIALAVLYSKRRSVAGSDEAEQSGVGAERVTV